MKVYLETPLIKMGEVIISSNIREATEKEIKSAKRLFKKSRKCSHSLVYDIPYYMYDDRKCYICGEGLGLI